MLLLRVAIDSLKLYYMYQVNKTKQIFTLFFNVLPIMHMGDPFASILRRSLGLLNTTFRGSIMIWNSSCAEVFCIAYGALCPFYNSALVLYTPDLTCASWTADTYRILLVPAGQLIHTRSKLFCQTVDTYPIYLAPARQLKQSGSNLCYISWTTDLYVYMLDN